MIKIFISSTFTDMHAERDGIQMQILPQLRKKVESLGENFDFCDLRWGINTHDIDEEDRMSKILEVCFQEISKCSDSESEIFMIVMLGERYGSCPDKSRIDDVLKQMNDNTRGHRFTADEVVGKSYTHLEVNFGPLADDEQFRRTIFMFRDPIAGAPENFLGSAEDGRNLSLLKARIREKSKRLRLDNVVDYSLTWTQTDTEGKIEGIDEFCERLKSKLLQTMEPSLSKLAQRTAEERAEKRHWLYVQKKAGYFCGMDELLEQCKKNLGTPSGNLVLHGPSGIGKSCLLCKAAEIKREEGANVYPFICENAGGWVSKTEIYLEWIAYLERLLGSAGRVAPISGLQDAKEKENEAYKAVLQLLYTYDNRPDLPALFMFVDGADKIDREGEIGYSIPIVSNRYKKIKFVYSFQYDNDIFRSDAQTHYIAVTAENSNAEKMLRSNINAAGKELSTETINDIVARYGDRKPNYLKLLLKRFSMLNAEDFKEGTGLESQRKLFAKLIEEAPSSEEEFARQLIELISNRTDAAQIHAVVSFLASSEKGLRAKDLQALLTRENIAWRTIDFYILINYLDEIFAERTDGTIDFADSQIKSFFEKKTDADYFRRKIFEYLRALPVEDPFRATNIFQYAYYADDKAFAISLIETQYAHDTSFVKALTLSGYNKLSWLLSAIRSGAQFGVTSRTVAFILDQFRRNPIPGGYSLMHALYKAAVQFCEEHPDEVGISDLVLSQAQLAYYSHNYGAEYDPVKEGEKAVALFKQYEDRLAPHAGECLTTYLNYVGDLINCRLYEKAYPCLSELYGLMMKYSENGCITKARTAQMLFKYADLYEDLHKSDAVKTDMAKLYGFCLTLLADEGSDLKLYGFTEKIAAIFVNVAKKEYLDGLSEEEAVKQALRYIPLMEQIAEAIQEDAVYSALAVAYKNYAKAIRAADCGLAVQYAENAYNLFERLKETGSTTQAYMVKIIETAPVVGQAYYAAERYGDAAAIYTKGLETVNEYVERFYVSGNDVDLYEANLELCVGVTEANVRLGNPAAAYDSAKATLFYLSDYGGHHEEKMAEILTRIFSVLPAIWADENITSAQVISDVDDAIKICNSDWLKTAAIFGYRVPDGYLALQKIGEGARICGKKGDFQAEITLRKRCITETENYYREVDNVYAFIDALLELYYDLAAAYERSGNLQEAYNVLSPHTHLISKFCERINGWEKKSLCIRCYELLARADAAAAKKYYKQALKIVDREIYAYGDVFLTVPYFGSYLQSAESLLEDSQRTLKAFDEYGHNGQCMARRELASNYITLGGIFQRAGDHEKARLYYQCALAYCRDVLEAGGGTDLDKWLLAMATNAVAVLSEVQGEKTAFAYFGEALSLFEQVHYVMQDGKREPTVVGMDERLGVLLNRAFSEYPAKEYTNELRKEDLARALDYANKLQQITGSSTYKKYVQTINAYLRKD